MTDSRSSPEQRRAARKIPPLVWIVLALLVAWLVVALVQWGGTHRTPQGGETPMQAEGPSVMPAAPPSGAAPGTPAGVVNAPEAPEAAPAE